MLVLNVTGDTHPKTFTLVTDDSDGELDRLQEIIHVEMDAPEDDKLRVWLDSHSADDFKEGVVVPDDEVGEFEIVLEGDWPEEGQKIESARVDYMRQVEAEAASGD